MTKLGATDSWLREHCPRLARARDQFIEYRAEQWRIEGLRQTKLLELQRLVAHRELQLVRALNTGSGQYIRRRQAMLKSAQRRLQTVERKAA